MESDGCGQLLHLRVRQVPALGRGDPWQVHADGRVSPKPLGEDRAAVLDHVVSRAAQ